MAQSFALELHTRERPSRQAAPRENPPRFFLVSGGKRLVARISPARMRGAAYYRRVDRGLDDIRRIEK